MALANYDDLSKEFESWMHRDDLGTKFDTFLRMAEVEIYSNPDEALKILSQETIAEATLDITTRFLALPAGINSQTRLIIKIDDNNLKVPYVSPSAIRTCEESGTPTQFTISNGQIEFNRIPDDTYTVSILYSLTDDPLTVTNQTNTVMTRYPNIYLFGCLSNAFAFVADNEEASKYSQFFLQAIRDANRRERMIKYPTGINIKSPRVV